MKRVISRLGSRRLVMMALVGLVSACSSGGPTDPVEDDLVVGGLVIRDNGVNVASVLGSQVTGELQGQEGTTGSLLSIIFVDDEGVQFVPFANEIMDVTVADESIAIFIQEGTFTGKVTSKTEGATTMTFRFLQAGTPIYTSPPVPIMVFGPIE
jgi:hypothetical protein